MKFSEAAPAGTGDGRSQPPALRLSTPNTTQFWYLRLSGAALISDPVDPGPYIHSLKTCVYLDYLQLPAPADWLEILGPISAILNF